MRRLITTAAAIVLATVIVPAALAATATPFGGATTSGGVLRLVSNTGDAGATNDFSGASFAGTGVTTFASITTLSTEFNVTDDDCAGGSPRFQVRVQTPVGREERVRLPRPDAVVHRMLAERLDRLREPDRLRRTAVTTRARCRPGRRCRRTHRRSRSSARTRSPASRWWSTPAGRSPTRSRRSTFATSRSTRRRSSSRRGRSRLRGRG